MKAVFAMDSFKSSLTSQAAGQAAAAGLRRVYPDAETSVLPLADGGEGTAAALVNGLGGHFVPCRVRGALGEPIDAQYGLLPDGTAVIGMAAAAGIEQVPSDRRNPMHTTTFGVGQLICDAIGRGCRRFWIGIGGSATNDGGIGMLQALGFGFFNADGAPVSPDGAGLCALARISADDALPALRDCTFRVACDVTNPLCGPNGCSAVFGPQKGADSAMIAALDGALARYAAQMRTVFPDADPDFPGSGAAGGMGFALRAALRQSPDAILLGEMRDAETIRAAVTAAETGHLVISTLHTIGAANTIDRIVDSFPPEQQGQIRTQIALVLEGVVSQTLIPAVDGTLVPAFEVMTANNAVRNLIRESKAHQLDNVIAQSAAQGMITLDQSILKLAQAGRIAPAEALRYCMNPEWLQKRLSAQV